MSFSSGTFSINSAGQPVVTGTVISSTAFNALTADLATGLSTCVLKDGTQTLTANIPMSSFKFTGLAAGTAAGNSVRWEQAAPGVLTTTGDVLYASAANTPARLGIGTARQQLATNSGATAPEWVASMQSILTTTGDTIQTTAANTPARLAATASVAAHATTSDVWTARETVLTGVAVTFTAVANAPYVGAVAWVYQNAAHTWTDGAVFDVQGNANYTATIGDWVRINAVTVSTFDVTIFKADGAAVVGGTTSGTAVTLTTQTAVDFTGLPAGTKHIAVLFAAASLSGTDNILVQIGTSAGPEVGSYASTSEGTGAAIVSSTTGFIIQDQSAGNTVSGVMFISLLDSATNTWVSSHSTKSSATVVQAGGGDKSLTGVLTQVRITRTGTDTMDAGKVNVLYWT